MASNSLLMVNLPRNLVVRLSELSNLQRTEGGNPTIGIILCSEKDQTAVKYSILKENKQLFASWYRLYLPSEEELIAEIDREKYIIGSK